MLALGSQFAGYRVERLLGRGGMGEVYLVENLGLRRTEALKVVTGGTGNTEFARRFVQEAQTIAALDHPNLVTIYYQGIENDQPWFTMQYLPGIDLRKVAPLPTDQVATILRNAAAGLDYAHGRGIVHRDIKPGNISASRRPDGTIDRVTVLDFGIARATDGTALTRTDQIIGTVAYSAPEILQGQPATAATDQYALACTAFELLTGQLPYAGEHLGALTVAHLTAPPPNAGDVDPALARLDPVLSRALSKDPADRFATCTEFADAFTRAATESAASPTSSVPPRPSAPAPAPGPFGQPVPVQQQPEDGETVVAALAPTVPVSAPADATPTTGHPVPSGPRRKKYAILGAAAVLILALVIILPLTLLRGGDEIRRGDDPETTTESAAPPATDSPIAVGGSFGCLIEDGVVLCWGDNTEGELGDGSEGSSPQPYSRYPVKGVEGSALSVAAAGNSACALTSDHQVYCWGAGKNEATLIENLPPAIGITVGADHKCAWNDDGRAWCWGSNNLGQLGDATSSDTDIESTSPSPVAFEEQKVISMSAGFDHTCAVTDGGELWCWGGNEDGQLGTDTADSAGTNTPQYVDFFKDTAATVTAVSADNRSTCAVVDGEGFCWGWRSESSPDYDEPMEVDYLPRLSSEPGAISGDRAFGCAITELAGVYCWGANDHGQLGRPGESGDADDFTDAGAVPDLDDVAFLSVEPFYSTACVENDLGDRFCWGNGEDGQLGDGKNASSSTPVKVTISDGSG